MQSTEADVFSVHVIIHTVTGTFASESRFFDATKWRFSCGNETFIDAHHARLEAFRYSPHLSVIVAVEIVGQSSSRAIGYGYSFVFRVKSETCQTKNQDEIGLK